MMTQNVSGEAGSGNMPSFQTYDLQSQQVYALSRVSELEAALQIEREKNAKLSEQLWQTNEPFGDVSMDSDFYKKKV